MFETTWKPPTCGFFFFNDTATTEIYTLSLHDALPISAPAETPSGSVRTNFPPSPAVIGDRKSTRLNSSHRTNSYAVFCLKKKKHIKEACYINLGSPMYNVGVDLPQKY